MYFYQLMYLRRLEISVNYYEIDPCYTYSTPGLTWLCGLKYTKVRLKYYKEYTVNIYDTIQRGIRGGLASVLGDCHVICKNKEINPEYTGKRIIESM